MPPARRADPARLLFWTAVAAFVAVRIAAARASDLWFDELFSVGLASGDWTALLRGAAADQTNPPLFYALLKEWLAAGAPTPGWLRALPACIGALSAWPLARFFRRAGLGVTGAGLALAAIAALPALALPMAEVRSYALLLLLAAASGALTLALATSADGAHGLIDLTAVNVALAYTHYYGWFTIAGGAIALVRLRPDLRRGIALSLGVTALAFAPWAVAVAAAARSAGTVAPTLGWIARPGALELLRTPLVLLGGTTLAITLLVGAAVALPALAEAVHGLRAPGRDPAAATLALLALVPLLGAFAASWLLPRAIWGERYLIVAVPALIALAIRWARRSARWPAEAALAGVIVCAGVAGWRHAGDAKIPWRWVAHQLTPMAADSAPAPVYAFEGFTALPLAYYAGVDGDAIRVRPVAAIAAIDREGWFVARDSAWPGAAQWRTPAAALRAAGWTVTDSIAAAAPRQRIAAYRFRRSGTAP